MGRKALVTAVVLLFLLPAAYLAWAARGMPHFGHLHDDSIYFVAAKSLAEGRGYRILSLPAEPFETKYPPLWPLVLAGIWKVDPRFPENLRLAVALGWGALPLFLALAWRWFCGAGFGRRASIALCGMLALSPCVIVLSTTMMSDLAFSAALVAALLAIGRAERSRWAAPLAGVLAAAAYLIKTAALPLLITGPVWLALRRKYRAAAVMFVTMLPAVGWWTLWSRAHLTHAHDLVTLYYTDYLGYQAYNVAWHDLPVVMWKNLDGVFSGIAELVIFDVAKTAFGMHLARLLAVVAIAGTVRLGRRRGVTPYHWFAAAYVAILLVWHFPPNDRFMLPLFPLLLAGLATELGNLARVIRSSWAASAANRAVAVGMAAALGALACFAVALDADAVFRQFPEIIAQHRAVLASNRAAFRWIAGHVPDGAFYAYDDPVFFLYTGHHAASMPVAPVWFYREDRNAILRPFRRMPDFLREQHLDYLLFTAADFHRDLPGPERAEARRILDAELAFERLYKSDLSAVYGMRSAGLLPDRKLANPETIVAKYGNASALKAGGDYREILR